MSNVDKQYVKLIDTILKLGQSIHTRNSDVLRLGNLRADFNSTPLVSVRKTAWKLALREMEWFLSGSSNINDLHESVHHWWKPWANEAGVIPYNYGKQLRKFDGKDSACDQIEYLITGIRDHPYSRRNVITTWNTAEMVKAPITNCHGTVIQALVDPSNKIHLTMYQRSSDMALGMQHNWIQYWAMLLYIAKRSGKGVGTFTWLGGDCHLYKDHVRPIGKVIIQDVASIETPKLTYKATSTEFKAEDFSLEGDYKPINTDKLTMIV